MSAYLSLYLSIIIFLMFFPLTLSFSLSQSIYLSFFSLTISFPCLSHERNLSLSLSLTISLFLTPIQSLISLYLSIYLYLSLALLLFNYCRRAQTPCLAWCLQFSGWETSNTGKFMMKCLFHVQVHIYYLCSSFYTFFSFVDNKQTISVFN